MEQVEQTRQRRGYVGRLRRLRSRYQRFGTVVRRQNDGEPIGTVSIAGPSVPGLTREAHGGPGSPC
ncbi:hypothetical protein ACU4GD_45095 [Cupriavidus basilensis]